jgi:RimJ/RimL family protein N-acetyltransferase
MQLQAGSAVVREWRMEDVADLAREAKDRRIWLNLRDAFPHPYALEDAKRFISITLDMRPQTYFAIEHAGRCVGGIGYMLRTDVERVGAEIGYWLGVQHWGQGIVTAAVRAVSRHAFAAHPELQRLYAVPYASNPASARVLEKAGYVLEGTLRSSALKDGRLLDQWMYAYLRSSTT